jgi:hypothetical protein
MEELKFLVKELLHAVDDSNSREISCDGCGFFHPERDVWHDCSFVGRSTFDGLVVDCCFDQAINDAIDNLKSWMEENN